jgi:Flp pilus assembly protein TadG
MVMGGFRGRLWRRLAGASLLGPPRPPKGFMKPRRLVGEQGTAVVEFALVVPWLFLLLFGIFDFARALNYYNNLSQLAGQGARAAAVNLNPDGTVPTAFSIQSQLVNNYTTSGELRDGIHVCITHLPTDAERYVTVKAAYTFNFIPLVWKGGGAPSFTLKASSTKLYEGATPAAPSYAVGDQNGPSVASCP